MMKISKKIQGLLDQSKVKYETIEHRTTFTAFDTAATTARIKIKPAEIAKALVLKVGRDYVLALISSDKMLDMAKFKKTLNGAAKKERRALEIQAKKTKDAKEAKKLVALAGKISPVKKVEFAKEAWMKKNIFGKIGAVPPFSQLTKLKIFVDGPLLRQKQIYLGSGGYECLIKMTPAQYQKLEKELVKGSFGKKVKRK